MTFTRRQLPGTRSPSAILLTLPEIHHECICTWIASDYRNDGTSRWSPKKENSSCLADRFHRRLRASAEPS